MIFATHAHRHTQRLASHTCQVQDGTGPGYGDFELVFLCNSSCWNYLFCGSKSLLKGAPHSLRNKWDQCCKGLTQKHRRYRLLILTHKRHHIKHIRSHTLIRTGTQHPVVLSNHTASMYFCVVVSKECPCWAYSSLVNANPVCACVLILSWSQQQVLSHRGIVMIKKLWVKVRWEKITVERREKDWWRNVVTDRGVCVKRE